MLYLYLKPQKPIARIVVSARLVYNGQHVYGGGKVVVLMLPTVMGRPRRPLVIWKRWGKGLKPCDHTKRCLVPTILPHMFELTYNKVSHLLVNPNDW